MHIFYSEQPGNHEFILNSSESGHLARVLRLNRGDHVLVINGSGSLFECRVTDPDSKMARVEIVTIKENYNCWNYHLHIAIAPTKNMDRYEMFVEKAVEMGIDEITPLLSSRSERRKIKKERIQKIVISAMKQSLKTKMVIINDPVFLDDFLKIGRPGHKFIAHCIDSIPKEITRNIYKSDDSVTFLIGPEGDFTSLEVANAQEYGYRSISLGQSRLRTETAGIVACSLVYFANQSII